MELMGSLHTTNKDNFRATKPFSITREMGYEKFCVAGFKLNVSTSQHSHLISMLRQENVFLRTDFVNTFVGTEVQISG